MAKKELDIILQTESKAESRIEDAKAKARKILDQAAAESERIAVDSERLAKAKASEIIDNAKKDADLAHKEVLSEAASEIEEIKMLASKNFERAVELIIDRIIKAV